MKDFRIASRFSIIAMLLLQVLLAIMFLYVDIIKSVQKDLIYYVVAVLTAFLSFILFMNIFIKVQWNIKESKKRERLLFIISFLLFGIYILIVFIHPFITASISKYICKGQYLPFLSILIPLVFCIMAFIISFKGQFRVIAKHKYLLLPVYFSLSGLVSWFIYRPNSLNGDLYHFDAYFHSIYRVMQSQPYSDVNQGVYGFYGILIAPVLKIFGGSFINTILVYTVLTGIVMLCYFYVLDNIVDSFLVKILGAVGIVAYSVWGRLGLYLQMFPHRIIFVGIMLAYILDSRKRDEDTTSRIAANP